jgi:gamma-glutamylcyclotransferase (GGCT)/AIG2-like uncharacterized protein YtfP
MPLYFAYGANMDVAAMAMRCPGAKVIGIARLPRHRFFITADGYVSVMRAPNSTVHGVLWELVLSNVRALDRFEEVDRGLYAKIQQPVICETGPRRALVYVGLNAAPGKPRPGYMEEVLASAQAHQLPPAYVTEIARYLPGSRTVQTAPGITAKPAAPRASQAWSWGD